MARPVVGITTYLLEARFGAWETESALVPADYVRAIERPAAGRCSCRPRPTASTRPSTRVDGLVFSGGSDIDPELYGHEPHPETTASFRKRDEGELALLQAALERDMPVLAICRARSC